MDVIAVRRNPAPDPDATWVGGPQDMYPLLACADYVSLHVPVSAETRGLMNSAAFAAMKPTACLINVGRGDLVDRAALIEALDRKTIAGAGIDVYSVEPPDPADPLLGRPDVVATPHVGGVTEEALARIATRVAEILKELVGPRPA
jgi:glyoxylate reductase/D-3-phosphoglycerate dehydrogenase